MQRQEHIQRVISGEKGLNPYLDLFQIRVLRAEQGEVDMEMQVRAEYFQGHGAMQGGLLGALADEAMAYALLSATTEEELIATIDIAHQHLRPVSGGVIVARGSITKRGKRVAFLQCTLTIDSQPVLFSTSSFIITQKPA